MKKSKTTIMYHIQASIDGGGWRDTSRAFLSPRQARLMFDRILKQCYPTWRGLYVCNRIVRRKVTIETDEEIIVFSTPSHGKKRSILGEMFLPTWLSKSEKKKYKMREIPDAPDQYQPRNQRPTN